MPTYFTSVQGVVFRPEYLQCQHYDQTCAAYEDGERHKTSFECMDLVEIKAGR